MYGREVLLRLPVSFCRSDMRVLTADCLASLSLECSGEQEGGQRDAAQVLSCSLFATVLAVLHLGLTGQTDSLVDFRSQPIGAALLCAYLGFYACCAGDTW